MKDRLRGFPLVGLVTSRIERRRWQRESLEEELSRSTGDPLYNLCVPDGQSIRLPMIWVVDLFPPSYAGDMRRSILKQGWKDDWIMPDSDAAQKVREARQSGTYNFRNLVRLVAMDQPNNPLMGSTQSRLPKSFSRIDVSLIEMGSSLTAVCAAIELRPESSEALDRAMRRPASPATKRLQGGGFSIHHREEMSQSFVADAHRELREEARRWLSTHVPGVFAGEAAGRLPVMDLLVAAKASEPPDSLKASGMWRAVGVASDTSITESPELGGVRLNQYMHPRRKSVDRDIFSLYVESPAVVSAAGVSLVRGKSPSRTFDRAVKDRLAVYLSRLAISSLLNLKFSMSAEARDAAYRLHRGWSITSIKSLRESFLRGSLDTIAIARAIKNLTNKRHAYHWQATEFETRSNPNYSTPGKFKAPPENQLDYLAKRQSDEADDLLAQDSQTREVLGLVASFTAGVEGIRSQRLALVVAVLSLVVAIAAIAIVGM